MYNKLVYNDGNDNIYKTSGVICICGNMIIFYGGFWCQWSNVSRACVVTVWTVNTILYKNRKEHYGLFKLNYIEQKKSIVLIQTWQ